VTKPSTHLKRLREIVRDLTGKVLDLRNAALDAQEVLRAVAADRQKYGALATKAQQIVHQINSAVEPFKNDKHTNG
jgi:hypothetical protein